MVKGFSAKIKWVADQMRKASKMNTVGVFLGRVSRGGAVWRVGFVRRRWGRLFRLWFIWVIVVLRCSFHNHHLGMAERAQCWFWMVLRWGMDGSYKVKIQEGEDIIPGRLGMRWLSLGLRGRMWCETKVWCQMGVLFGFVSSGKSGRIGGEGDGAICPLSVG